MKTFRNRNLDDVLREIEEKRRAHPHYYRARDVYWRWHRRVTTFPRRLKWAHQRVVRGWDDTSLWRLDGWLAKTLGAQLVEMSEIAHGYPDDDYPYERWVADLRKHGEALQHYAEFDFLESPDQWDADVYPAARDALRWVADNLGSLWD